MSSQLICSQLLDQVSAILELRKKRQPVPGENFNVFSVLGMESDEAATHCRLLYELLTPEGSHGMGDCFLREFFEMVLHKPYGKDASVYREYKINEKDSDNYGRIDLLLQGSGFCYPIEVKIYAGDQWEQVKRYAEFASRVPDGQVYYLTLDGHEPSEESRRESEAVCLSFGEEIRKWLLRCGELAWNVPNVAETIRQYIRLLDKLTGNMEEDVFMDQIKKTAGMSQANFESAFEISKAVAELRVEMMQQFFREIEAHMARMEHPLEKLHSDYEEKAPRFCRNARGGSYPSLTYRMAGCNGLTVALRFEIEWNFYFGMVIMREDGSHCPQELHQLADAFPSQEWKDYIANHPPMGDWWIWWRHLPGGTEKDIINFKECSGRYPELFDPVGHKVLMEEIFAQIDRYIHNGLCH